MKPVFKITFAVLLAAAVLVACGDTEEREGAGDREGGERPKQAEKGSASKVAVVAEDYSFDVPAEIQGGLVELEFTNNGQEPHFAGLARVAPGKSFQDVEAAMTAAPSEAGPAGPPPFEDFAGIPTADPGAVGSATFNLAAGSYVFFCLIPSPDGVSHAAKGMVKELSVSEGSAGALPDSDVTVTATDFAFDATPQLAAGESTVRLRNEGEQLHEINLVELSSGNTMEDVVAWSSQPAGPPPMRSLAGVAIAPGEEATTKLRLESGKTYGFVCVIPDVLGDFAPHITKGMLTAPITVT